MSLVAPGLKKDDFKLHVANDMLTVSYERKESKENKEEGWLRREYNLESFSRSFHLDDSVHADKISASYENGILYLNLPKKENAKHFSKTIEIK